MKRVAILGAKRSAIGSFGGSLKGVGAVEIARAVIDGLLSGVGIDGRVIDEVIVGNVLSAGLGQNIARQIALKANLQEQSTAFCVNQVCGSGMKALELGYASIALAQSEIVLAGGVESMSNAPYVLQDARFGYKMGHQRVIDTMICDGLWCAMNDYHMGITAENLAKAYNISRQEQDEFALLSQQKASKAQQLGLFEKEIIPLVIPSKKGSLVFKQDEYIKHDANIQSLRELKPVFDKQGSITAGNASGINDGGAFLLLASEEKAKELGIAPLAWIESFGVAGVSPSVMGIGPISAVQKALKAAKLELDEIDLIESNEAFSVQSLSVAKELGFDSAKLNIKGGAIALGHPIGASGARIVVTLLHSMLEMGCHHGLATLCIGGGQGIAMIIKRAI